MTVVHQPDNGRNSAGLKIGRVFKARPNGVVLATLVLAAIVALPIIAVVSSLFDEGRGSLAHLASTILPELLLNTFGLIVMVGVGAAVVGTGTAWLVSACRFPGSKMLQWMLLLPLAVPAYIIGYAYTDFLVYAGPLQSALRDLFGWTRDDYWFPEIHSLWGVSLMLVLVLYPYVFFLARTAFQEQSRGLLDVARTLGRTPANVFLTVALPMARPAIAAGVALALMEAVADFGTVQYFGVQTFTTAIYRTWFGMGDRVGAAQLASGLLAFVFLLVVLEHRSRSRQAYYDPSNRAMKPMPIQLRGGAAFVAFALCAIPVLLGFVIPLAILFELHMSGGDSLLGVRILRYAGNSFVLAGGAAVIITACAVLTGYCLRKDATGLRGNLVRLATMGYAIPGTIIAVGVLIPLGAFDNWLDGMFRNWFGISTGLIFSGTVFALFYAYLVRFLAVANSAIETGFKRIPKHIDDVARTLGRTRAGVVATVHLPLLRRSMLMSMAIVFVDVLKELPATLIVRPFNFDTLAVRVYQLASDERLSEAASGSLVIVAIGLIPIILLTRFSTSRIETGILASALKNPQ
jgi:iron(III) transport system permease protein